MSLPSQVRFPSATALLLTLLALVPRANTQPYFTWAAEAFTPTDCAGGIAAPSRDPDRDGWPNLIEYALATDPGDPRSFPKLSFETDPPCAICSLPGDPRDAGVTIEVSDYLEEWQSATSIVPGQNSIRVPLGSCRMIRVRAYALPGPILDSDGDGLHDLFEESLARESAGDSINHIGDVAPLDDHDGDGIPNIDESESRHPSVCGFPTPPLLDPAAVATKADHMIPPPVLFSVHSPLR
jgi:hypothetical protein